MKILYMTDIHLTSRTPVNRLDNISVAIYKKFLEITTLVDIHQPTIVLIGGDLFNTAKISFSLAGLIAKIIKTWRVQVYVVPGSHDLYGYNVDTLNQTMLGMYLNTGVIEDILTRDKSEFFDDVDIKGNNIKIEIRGYEHSIRSDFKDLDMPDHKRADYQIQVIHDMVLDKPCHPDIPFVLTNEINTGADLVLCGHYHPGWKTHRINRTTFVNPGSLVRLDRSEHNKTFVPKVILIEIYDLNNVKIEEIPLKTAAKSEDIFDYSSKQTNAIQQQYLENFKNSLNTTASNITSVSAINVLNQLAQSNQTPQETIDLANKYIIEAEQLSDESSLSINGYIEPTQNNHLTSVIIKNFQSHDNTTIDFTNGLNAICGESNSGKSSVLRAINWALYNEPKGSDFIRTGSTKCSVTLNFSDGSSITRERDRNNSGTYSVTDCNGQQKDFKGFSHDIPIDVTNIHHMPKVSLSKDYSENLNIASQLEPPFLLGTSGANRAAAIGRLTGVQNVDLALRECQKNMKTYQADIKKLNQMIEDNNKDLNTKFNHLEGMKYTIDELELLITAKEDIDKELDRLKYMDSELNRISNNISITNNELASLPNMDYQLPLLDQASNLIKSINVFNNISNTRINIFNAVCSATTIYNLIPKESEYEPLIDEAITIINNIKLVDSIRQQLISNHNDITSTNNQLNDLKDIDIHSINHTLLIISDINELISINTSVNNISNDINIIEDEVATNYKQLMDTNIDIIKLQNELQAYLGEVGICPTCGNNLDQDHIKHIVRRNS